MKIHKVPETLNNHQRQYKIMKILVESKNQIPVQKTSVFEK